MPLRYAKCRQCRKKALRSKAEALFIVRLHEYRASDRRDRVGRYRGPDQPVKAEEAVLDEKGKIDPEKLQALIFDQFRHGYYVTGEQVGKAWNAGAALMKKK